MYIIYNQDGSIAKVKLTDFINKGSDGVNTISVAVKGVDLDGVSGNIQWTLPNGENVGPLPLNRGEPFDDDEGDHYEDCYVVSIDSPETLFEGILKGSLVLIDAQTRILYTYPIKLVVNPSTFVPDSNTTITTAQYANLVEYIENNYTKTYSRTKIDEFLAAKANKEGAIPRVPFNQTDNVFEKIEEYEIGSRLIWFFYMGTPYIGILSRVTPNILQFSLQAVGVRIPSVYAGIINDGRSTKLEDLFASQYIQRLPLPKFIFSPNDNVVNFLSSNNCNNTPIILADSNGESATHYFANIYYTSFGQMNFEIELIGLGTTGSIRYAGIILSQGSTKKFSDLMSSTYQHDYEEVNNKVTSLSGSSTNTKYPSAKAVVDYTKTMGMFMNDTRGLSKLYFEYGKSSVAPSPSDVLPQNFDLETFEPDANHTLDIPGVPLAVGDDNLGFFGGGTEKSMQIWADTFLYNERILAVYTQSGDNAIMLCVSPNGKKYIYYGGV